MTQTTIAQLYRYPLKGFSAQPIASVQLTAGEPFPFDRAFAIENGSGAFDEAAPRHLPKVAFLCLMRNEALAKLDSSFDDATGELTLSRDGHVLGKGDLARPEGRAAIEAAVTMEMAGSLRGPARMVSSPGHSFSDVPEKCVHIINRASLFDLEARIGVPVDAGRFRANIVIEGMDAWGELDLVGQMVRVGDVRLSVFKRTKRCAAVDVDPQTAVRAGDLPQLIMDKFGHRDFGIYAMVKAGGVIAAGDTIEVV